MSTGDFPTGWLARAVEVPLRRQSPRSDSRGDRPVTVAELTDKLGCNHNDVQQHLAGLHEAVPKRSLSSHSRRRVESQPDSEDMDAACGFDVERTRSR
jgi:hypothetical protein